MVVLRAADAHGMASTDQSGHGHREPPPSLPLLAPMLAVTTPRLPDRQDAWGFEAKLDGFRGLCYVDRGEIRVRSRSGKPMTWLPELASLGQALPGRRVILDGEVVALVDGRPSIEALQQRMRTRGQARGGAPVLLAVFDLLYLDDTLLIRKPYRQRRAMLEELNLAGAAFRTVPVVFGDGEAMLVAVREQELEGILAKRLDGPYRPGVRSQEWQKVLNRRRATMLVGGFVPTDDGLSAVLVGEPDPATAGQLRFAGRVDHGLSPRTRRALAAALVGLETARSPFTGSVGSGGWGHSPGPPPRWVRPILEVEVEHIGREPTSRRLRHPTFVSVVERP
jgi:bifunctional non-homologous end joining protein LigD